MAIYNPRLLRTKTVICCICFCMVLSCNNVSENSTTPSSKNSETQPSVTKDTQQKRDTQAHNPKLSPDEPKQYSNTRFKEVTVQKLSEGRYKVQGRAQVFEASFGWVVEDGHNELNKGHQMTDAGAPEWGHFQFTVEAKKQRQGSTLTLILFEESAKDGSRQHELPVTLE